LVLTVRERRQVSGFCSGLLRRTAGEARILGHDSLLEPYAVRERVGYSPQQNVLPATLSVIENMHFFADLHGVSAETQKRRIPALLDFAGLAEVPRRLASRLSGGMKKKLALACSLVHAPRVVVLDEPTLGVDPVSRREFWSLLGNLRAEQGLTIFVCTPYMDEAELCQRVGFISRGRLVALGTPALLKRTQMRGHVLEIATSDPDRALRVLRDARQRGQLPLDEVALYGAQIHAIVPDALAYRDVVRSTLADAQVRVDSIQWIAPLLEDVFISSVTAA
jgi:ABC-2 type transport system ATP-binding protein